LPQRAFGALLLLEWLYYTCAERGWVLTAPNINQFSDF
jgi:hypothetical protein